MTLPPGFTISGMRDEEVAALDAWAAAEGWNPGLADLSLARATDPDAFIALRVGGELGGGGSVFSYDGGFGFMGLFIVRADLRKKGLGKVLWHWRFNYLRQRLSAGASIGMDGVYDLVPFYERGGFRRAFRDLRFEGIAAGAEEPGIVSLDGRDFAEIERYDRAFVPAPRGGFLRRWIGQPGAHVMGLREDGQLVGYGVARPCRVGFKIGPMFADRVDVAHRVLAALMGKIEGHQVQIEVPEVNAAAVRLAGRFDLSPTFGCVRLYYGPMPKLPINEIFGVTSLEFG